MARPRYLSWLLQAESDLRSVADLLKTGHYAQACFNSQQAAEKALKALSFYRGFDLVKSHSVGTISKDLNLNGELSNFALRLDLYYLTARYPDALPEHGVPSEKFTKDLAEEALKMAEVFLAKVKSEVNE